MELRRRDDTVFIRDCYLSLSDVTYAIITECRTHNLSRAQIFYGLILLIFLKNFLTLCDNAVKSVREPRVCLL